MTIEAAIVRINAVVFTLYGLLFIFLPELASQAVTGSVPATASGLIDMRATYGGMSLAFGVLLFVLASGQAANRQGLLAVIFVMLGMAGARLVGIVLDGAANLVMYAYLGLEIAMAAIASWGWVRERRGTDA